MKKLTVVLALLVLTGCSITVITTKDSAQLTMDNPGLVGVVTGLPEKVKVQPQKCDEDVGVVTGLPEKVKVQPQQTQECDEDDEAEEKE